LSLVTRHFLFLFACHRSPIDDHILIMPANKTSLSRHLSQRLLLSAIVLLSICCGARAQTAPDAPELTKLLRDFLAGASRNDLAAHERFWADDLVYTASAGRRIGKADILREVREEGPPKPGDEATVFTAEDVRIQQYGDTAIVAFRLVGTTVKDGEKTANNYLNTGTFLKRDGKWQVVAWQATAMPKKEQPKP
jgi:ketosteroid isomerase-like protein